MPTPGLPACHRSPAWRDANNGIWVQTSDCGPVVVQQDVKSWPTMPTTVDSGDAADGVPSASTVSVMSVP
jgi:hypothetical protein